LAFLFWGCVFLGLWLLIGFLTFGLSALFPDSVVVQVLIFALALLAGVRFCQRPLPAPVGIVLLQIPH
jgi:hypothetical protein